ncbi:tRNA (adenosine(37)-N6)-dimethylallyltransferase MiaA [Chloroflexota bacterium]
MNRLVAIVGPTGIGKSRLAIRLAQEYNGEIVSADSRQVYRRMDIGTAKPSPDELSAVPHHLINVINPDEPFSLAEFHRLAYGAITDIQHRNKLPLFVGGSGQYIWAVLEGWKAPGVPPDAEFRYNLEKQAAENGSEELYQELLRVDPEAARKIDRRNVRRVIRALEVFSKTDTPFSQLKAKEPPPFDTAIIGLTTDRAGLYHIIDHRVDMMIEQGLVAEVEYLVNMGYDYKLSAMSSIGYQQIGMFLKGDINLESAVQQIKTETHRFVRRQYAWFRLKDKRIHWFDIINQNETDIANIIYSVE